MNSIALVNPPTDADTHPLWQYVFGNARPVDVEIGCGTGTFILHAAAENPDTNYFGIERAYRRARIVEAGRSKQSLDNVRILAADAGCIVEAIIPEASVHAFHIYFPDPWWKRRHFHRRYFTDAFAKGLERALVPGGTLYLATDVDEVMCRMLAAVTQNTALVRHPERRSPRVRLTVFERKGIERGAEIHDAVFVKQAR